MILPFSGHKRDQQFKFPGCDQVGYWRRKAALAAGSIMALKFWAIQGGRASDRLINLLLFSIAIGFCPCAHLQSPAESLAELHENPQMFKKLLMKYILQT